MSRSDQLDNEIGDALCELLRLPITGNGRIKTAQGIKTKAGLVRAIRATIEEETDRFEASL